MTGDGPGHAHTTGAPERHWSGPGAWDSEDRRAWTVGVGGLLLQLTVMAALVAV